MSKSTRRTRVLLTAMPQMLRDIVERTLASEESLDLVSARESSRADARQPVGASPSDSVLSDADVIITAYDGAQPNGHLTLLNRAPRARLLLLLTEGQHSVAYTLRPTRMCLGDLSPGQLLEVVRSATSDWETSARHERMPA